MAEALTTVVQDLSTKVDEHSRQMSDAMAKSAGMATDAANTVIQQADSWSEQSAKQLKELLNRHQSQLDQMQELGSTLGVTLPQFKDALGQYREVTTALNQAT